MFVHVDIAAIARSYSRRIVRGMSIARRDFLITAAGAGAAAAIGPRTWGGSLELRDMYGLIGKMTAVVGQRDALITILLEGTVNMPGCLSYIVARDAVDANAIWITEVWDSKASHDTSLSLPRVRDAIARGRPLIASFGDGIVTTPIGGQGLPPMAR
jgi:quinol monooxygenase YgiN